jgi:hypothetical protein
MSKRDAYVKRMQAQLDEWNRELDGLEAKAKKADAEARAEYEKRLEDVRAKRDDALARMEEFKNASDDAFEEIRDGVEKAWSDLRKSLVRARDRMKS